MNEKDAADLLWEQAEATGNTDALCVATALTCLIDATKGNLPFEICLYCSKMLTPTLAKGLGVSEETFLDFILAFTRIRNSNAPEDTPPPGSCH